MGALDAGRQAGHVTDVPRETLSTFAMPAGTPV